ncbi:GSCOCT00007082001.2-RA-CDS [Cotesia congregata]|uniref:Glutathione S-transferase Delta 2 n=1 Tax=Cotesia congregata TaxID=51543 RepID=A0A8J2H9V8_COTCN|nr:GSCOCT00007082001.2-RA-CDS [Cotesia congregata]CAG5082580.1 glutathione S-transferase Delta 2 [Cotesia congregata]
MASSKECSKSKVQIDLYYRPGSPPCTAIRLVAAALGINLNLTLIDFQSGESLKPEYLKLNPQTNIPTMVDDGFSLWERINTEKMTLCTRKTPKHELVDQRLYFDFGTWSEAFTDYFYPILFCGAPRDQSKYDKIAVGFDLLERFLEGQNYVAGSQLTIADLALIVTVSNLEVIKYDFSRYKNVNRWATRIKAEAISFEECNGEGLKAFQELIDYLTQ